MESMNSTPSESAIIRAALEGIIDSFPDSLSIDVRSDIINHVSVIRKIVNTIKVEINSKPKLTPGLQAYEDRMMGKVRR